MYRKKSKISYYGKQIPVFTERGEDGFYIAECPIFEGCYSQGKTIDEALRNIREVISLILEDKKTRSDFKKYSSSEIGIHALTV